MMPNPQRLLLLALLVGCDDGPARQRADAIVDAVDASADAALDAAVPPDAAPDAAPDDAALDDAAPPDALPPDAAPPVPEVCNGQDEDADGLIDEGVANVCGGCGGLPAEGCQAWGIDLIEGVDGRLNPDRAVGLQGSAIGFSEREIEGASCAVIRQVGTLADAHLGQVTIESPRAMLNLGPVYDANRGGHRYLNNPETGPLLLHGPGDAVTARAGGGLLVAAFELSATAPAALADVQGLDRAADLARARADDSALELRWGTAPAAEQGDIRFFIGGSAPISTNVVYRSIRHYQLEATLVDDGELSLPAGFFGGGVAESAIWARLDRARAVRLPLGPHSVEMVVGRRTQIQEGGRLEPIADVPPFQIVDPSPNVRDIVPGEPLRVAWGELPPGDGPLVVALTTYDGERDESRQVSCLVPDPSVGAIELPAEFTEDWPMGEADLRQLSVRYDLAVQALPPPDRGQLTQSITVLLKLNP
ncbi:MAG: hypothetical protein H6706_27995 [Myxococcales bacterium]|nr:hypothetical protein [Myxococcales bacterium]